MDGNLKSTQSTHSRRPSRVVAAIAVQWLAGVLLAATPPTLTVDVAAQPLSAPRPGQAQLVRPPAKVLLANDVSTTQLTPSAESMEQREGQEPHAAIPTLGNPALAVAPTPSGASPRPIRFQTVEEALETRGSVTFRKTPLSEVVFMLSDLWRINIVAGENVTGDISGTFHDAPLREVLSAVLTAGGYSYRKTGNSLIVLPAEKVGSDDPAFVTETIRIPMSLQNDDSTMQAAQLLLSERGRLQKIGDAGMLVMDTAPRIARIRQLF
jgi:general secretion pathway protein D